MRKFTLAICAAAMAVPVMPVLPTTAAFANHNGYYHGKTWRDSRGRVRCRRANGTVGIIVGGAAGALVGRAVDGGRNRTVGHRRRRRRRRPGRPRGRPQPPPLPLSLRH